MQFPAAEAAFAEFTKAYPDAKSLSDIGLARLAVSERISPAPRPDSRRSSPKPKASSTAGAGKARNIWAGILFDGNRP